MRRPTAGRPHAAAPSPSVPSPTVRPPRRSAAEHPGPQRPGAARSAAEHPGPQRPAAARSCAICWVGQGEGGLAQRIPMGQPTIAWVHPPNADAVVGCRMSTLHWQQPQPVSRRRRVRGRRARQHLSRRTGPPEGFSRPPKAAEPHPRIHATASAPRHLDIASAPPRDRIRTAPPRHHIRATARSHPHRATVPSHPHRATAPSHPHRATVPSHPRYRVRSTAPALPRRHHRASAGRRTTYAAWDGVWPWIGVTGDP